VRVAVILLSWQRPQGTIQNLKDLSNQTVEGFRVIISNSNPRIQAKLDKIKHDFKDLDIQIVHESNEYSAFRRFFIARQQAMEGIDVILFIDDDITVPSDYIEKALKQYKEKTYSSAYTWTIQDNGSDYYNKRTRVFNSDESIKYCGAGISMIDAKIFLDDGLFNAPDEAYTIDDLWLSYYSDHVAKYKLRYLDIDGINIGGNDHAALYKSILKQKYTKADFLRHLVGLGWKV
jgi:hypothetical protein